MDIEIHTPITEEVAAGLQIGDTITITGYILCGRDAVLPRVVEMVKEGRINELGVSYTEMSSFILPLVLPVSDRHPVIN